MRDALHVVQSAARRGEADERPKRQRHVHRGDAFGEDDVMREHQHQSDDEAEARDSQAFLRPKIIAPQKRALLLGEEIRQEVMAFLERERLRRVSVDVDRRHGVQTAGADY